MAVRGAGVVSTAVMRGLRVVVVGLWTVGGVLGFTFVSHFCLESVVMIGDVGHFLDSAIGKGHGVRSFDFLSI